MRCAARYLFKVCSVMSLVLCALVCVVWIRSYRLTHYCSAFYDVNTELRVGRIAWARIAGGGILLQARTLRFKSDRDWHFDWVDTVGRRPRWSWDQRTGSAYPRGGDVVNFSWAGFSWGREINTRDPSAALEEHWIVMPLWLAAVVSAAPPAHWLRRFIRRQRRVHDGHCPACGYDLRATPDRCPECGATSDTSVGTQT